MLFRLPRLSAGILGDAYDVPDLSRYTEKQRRTAYIRAACVRSYQDARANWRGDQKTWLPLLVDKLKAAHPSITISAASLRRWHRKYKRPADIAELIDRRGRNKGDGADAETWDYFQSIFLSDRKPSKKVCWLRTEEFAQAQGLQWCGYDACCRQLDERIPPELQTQFRDPKEYRHRYSTYLNQDPEAYKAGERWDGDHSQLDFWCLYNGRPIRPWITAWLDWRSRRVVGWVLTDAPNSSTVLAAFRMAMLDDANMGGPDIVWIDLGREYESYMFLWLTKA